MHRLPRPEGGAARLHRLPPLTTCHDWIAKVLAVLTIRETASLLVQQFQAVKAKAWLAADEGTAAMIRSAVAIHYGKHKGKFPSSKDAVVDMLRQDGRAPEFMCPGNDFDYEPATGAVTLQIQDAAHC